MHYYQSNRACSCSRCRCRGLMGPVVLVTLGVLFLLSEFHVAQFHRTWPILLIAIGVVSVLSSSADVSGHLERNGGNVPPVMPPSTPETEDPNREPRQVNHV